MCTRSSIEESLHMPMEPNLRQSTAWQNKAKQSQTPLKALKWQKEKQHKRKETKDRMRGNAQIDARTPRKSNKKK